MGLSQSGGLLRPAALGAGNAGGGFLLSGFLRPDNDDGRINLVKVENLLQLVYPPVVSEGVILPLALPGSS